jgi:nickel/cobalt transporter (NicO) family protein
MMNGWLLTLMFAAASVGSLHSLAPDHWVPFAALSRARGWSSSHTARLTILCGLGHVSVSAILGLVALFIGLETVHAFGARLEDNAIYLLIGFGILYTVWGLRRSFARDPLQVMHSHQHHHPHGHNDHDHGLTEWSLFLLFSADPCVAVIPMIMAASVGGGWAVVAVVVTYELATIATMVFLVAAARAGANTLKFAWFERYGDAAAGALIVTVGTVLSILGV